MSVFDGFRFRRGSSVIHKLDPRVKFFFVCVLFVITILFSNLMMLVLLFFLPLPLIVLSGVKREWLRSLKGAALLAIFIFIMNFLFGYLYPGTLLDPPVDTFSEHLYILERAIALTLRFVVLVGSFSVFFLTTSPDHLGLALEQSHIPYEFSFAFTTAVRFVPVLAEEAQSIMDAQKARGLELERGNFIKRVKNYIPILIPLIVSAIRRSIELAEAMESRGWGAKETRTNLYILKLTKSDGLVILGSLVMLLCSIYVWIHIPLPSLTTLLHRVYC